MVRSVSSVVRPCMNENKVKIPATVEPAFLVSGFTNWKDATNNYNIHIHT